MQKKITQAHGRQSFNLRQIETIIWTDPVLLLCSIKYIHVETIIVTSQIRTQPVDPTLSRSVPGATRLSRKRRANFSVFCSRS